MPLNARIFEFFDPQTATGWPVSIHMQDGDKTVHVFAHNEIKSVFKLVTSCKEPQLEHAREIWRAQVKNGLVLRERENDHQLVREDFHYFNLFESLKYPIPLKRWYLECTNPPHNKFYRMTITMQCNGGGFAIMPWATYGRIGSKGSEFALLEKADGFAAYQTAEQLVLDQVAAKLAKGYHEIPI